MARSRSRSQSVLEYPTATRLVNLLRTESQTRPVVHGELVRLTRADGSPERVDLLTRGFAALYGLRDERLAVAVANLELADGAPDVFARDRLK